MTTRKASKKLLTGFVILSVGLLTAIPIAVAENTEDLVYRTCTECHPADKKGSKVYWEEQKKTEKQWSELVDKMVRYGALLTDKESNLVIEYLTAMSEGDPKAGGDTKRPEAKKKIATAESGSSDRNSQKIAQDLTTTTTTLPPTTTTTEPPTTTTILTEQAETGVEMIWYLLGGGMLVGSGMKLRNRDKQLKK